MGKVKVLFFIYQMGGGGAARTMLNILNHMDKEKFTPILVTLDYSGDYEDYLHPDIKFIKLKTKRLRSAIFPLAKVIRQEKADIVFSTIPNYNTIAILARLLSFTDAKNIVREAAYLGGSPAANYKLLLYGMLYRLAKQIISLSDGVKDNLIKRYKANPKKIKVIYNPVDLQKIQQSAADGQIEAPYKRLFASDEKIVVTAGRLVNDKDQKTLIKAFANVNQKIKSHLLILGEGELAAELKKFAKSLGVEQNVHFLGFQRNPYAYFKAADLFVLSSIHEGFGHVLVEALATGTPVVSTNAKPGAAEVLDNGKYGRLCNVGDADELADAMYEVLTLETKKREEMIDNGLKRAEQFNAAAIVKQYENVFLQTVTKLRR